MPGPYAHITLLNEIFQPDKCSAFFPRTSAIRTTLLQQYPYCMLGAVSPDYPNLVTENPNGSFWSDTMHCTRAGDMITSGIERVRAANGSSRDKQFSWLLGYSAHVATDITIHPVVQAKVGPYSENQRQHRVCEMNQDSYIYRRMHQGEIGATDSFALCIAQCSNVDDRYRLDPDIVNLWEGMLADVYPELFTASPPDILAWHEKFVSMTRRTAIKERRLFPLAGIISNKIGLDYPAYDSVDRQFIEEQLVPKEAPLHLHYDDIFYHATCNVAVLWRRVEEAIFAPDSSYLPDFYQWNLDTGRDGQDRLVFW